MDLIVKDPRGLRIGGESLEKGDSFTISDREGGLLVAIGKAEPDPKAEKSQKQKAKQPEKPKGDKAEKANQEEKASKGIFSRFKKGGSNEKSKA